MLTFVLGHVLFATLRSRVFAKVRPRRVLWASFGRVKGMRGPMMEFENCLPILLHRHSHGPGSGSGPSIFAALPQAAARFSQGLTDPPTALFARWPKAASRASTSPTRTAAPCVRTIPCIRCTAMSTSAIARPACCSRLPMKIHLHILVQMQLKGGTSWPVYTRRYSRLIWRVD